MTSHTADDVNSPLYYLRKRVVHVSRTYYILAVRLLAVNIYHKLFKNILTFAPGPTFFL